MKKCFLEGRGDCTGPVVVEYLTPVLGEGWEHAFFACTNHDNVDLMRTDQLHRRRFEENE